MKPDSKDVLTRNCMPRRESNPTQTIWSAILTSINTKDNYSKLPKFWTLWFISKVIKYLWVVWQDAVEQPLFWSSTSQCSADIRIGIIFRAWNSLLPPATLDLLQICSQSCKFSTTTKPIVNSNLRFVSKKKKISFATKAIRRDRQDLMLSKGSWLRLARKDSLRKMLTNRDTSISKSTKTIVKREMEISLLIMKTSGRESTTMNLLVLKL